MANDINKTDATLHAFLDGQLNAEGRKKVQDFLKSNNAKRQELEQNIQVNEYLRKQFAPLMRQTLPTSIQQLLQITPQLRPQPAPSQKPPSPGAPVAAAGNSPEMDINLDEFDLGGQVDDEHMDTPKWRFVFHQTHDWHSNLLLITSGVTFLLGLFIGYLYPTIMHSGNNNQELLDNLVMDTHRTFAVEKAHVVEVAATDITHLTNWLSSKLELAVAPAILEKFGFSLAGGRLLPSNGENAAVYIYRKADDSQLTLYIRNQTPLSGKMDSSCEQKTDTLLLCHWQGENLNYFIATEEPAAKALELVKDAESQLRQ